MYICSLIKLDSLSKLFSVSNAWLNLKLTKIKNYMIFVQPSAHTCLDSHKHLFLLLLFLKQKQNHHFITFCYTIKYREREKNFFFVISFFCLTNLVVMKVYMEFLVFDLFVIYDSYSFLFLG